MSQPNVIEDLHRLELYAVTSEADRMVLRRRVQVDGSTHVNLRHRDKVKGAVRVRIVGVDQPRGGIRLAWSCPSCDRRARVLFYGGVGAPVCWRCTGLMFRSQATGHTRVYREVTRHAKRAVGARRRRLTYTDGRRRGKRQSPRQTRLEAIEHRAIDAALTGAAKLRTDPIRSDVRAAVWSVHADRVVDGMVRDLRGLVLGVTS